jgi:pyrroline-5-carboxylate reductase
MDVMKLGFIGFGRMGSLLGNALVNSGAISGQNLYINDIALLNPERLPEGVKVVKTPQEAINQSDMVFICVKPTEVISLIKDLGFDSNKLVVSIAVGVTLSQLSKHVGDQVIRIIPSYTQKVFQGIILYAAHENLKTDKLSRILSLLNLVGHPLLLDESKFELAADVSSCAPAFWAFMLDTVIQEAVTRGLPKEIAGEIALQTLIGSSQAFLKENDLASVPQQVATPGGITAEGMEVLKAHFPDLIKQVFDRTLAKYDKLSQILNKQSE